MEECLNTVAHKVTPYMLETLSGDYIIEEIKAVLFQMGPKKASGLDVMNALFYKKFWYILGDNVTKVVLDF